MSFLYTVDATVTIDELLQRPGDVARSAHVHLFAIDTRRVAIHCYSARFRSLLSAEERKRHSAYRYPDDADVYLCTHALKRLALARIGGRSAEAWRFSCTDLGQPYVCAPASELRFSLSHTNGLAACAIADGVPIGLDAEWVDADVEVSRSLQSLCECERRDVMALPASERLAAYFERWTVKEAYLKAVGVGLHKPMSSFACHRHVGNSFRIDGVHDANAWYAHSWNVGGHQLAIVIRQPSIGAVMRVYNCIDTQQLIE